MKTSLGTCFVIRSMDMQGPLFLWTLQLSSRKRQLRGELYWTAILICQYLLLTVHPFPFVALVGRSVMTCTSDH
jgi:hypothetical protein